MSRPRSTEAARQTAMATLAGAPADELAALCGGLDLPAATALRGPETGLVTVRGRIGGGGAPFNVGEATVTRASVRLADGRWVTLMRSAATRQGQASAVLDALWQNPGRRDEIEMRVLAPLRAAQTEADARRREEIAATKVDFFTMVRGEDCMTVLRSRSRAASPIRCSTARPCSDAVWTRWRARARASRCRPRPRRRRRSAATAAAAALTLCDHDTPLWLDLQISARHAGSVAWLAFHTGAPVANRPADAHFALVASPARDDRPRRLRAGHPGIPRPVDNTHPPIGPSWSLPARRWCSKAPASVVRQRHRARAPLPRHFDRAVEAKQPALPARGRHHPGRGPARSPACRAPPASWTRRR